MKAKKTYSLRALRQAKGMTLAQLAEKTSIADSTICALETGRGKRFNVATKHTLADFFHVEMLDLFPEEREHVEKIVGKHQLQFFLPPMDEKKD